MNGRSGSGCVGRPMRLSRVPVVWGLAVAWGLTSWPAVPARAQDAQRATQALADVTAALDRAARRPAADEPAVREHFDAAQDLLADREYELALEELDAALRVAEGDCYDLLYLLAQVHQERGRLGQARLAAELALAYRPGDANAHYWLGRLHREQGHRAAALRHLGSATAAAQREPDNPRVTAAWYELGATLEAEGYLLAAAEAFAGFDDAIWRTHPEHRTATEVAPLLLTWPHGMIERRLELLARVELPDQRVAATTAALAARPDEPYVQRLHVRALQEAGRAGDAFRFCRERLAAPGAGAPALLSAAIEAGQAAGQLGGWLDEIVADLRRGQGADFAARLARRIEERGEPAQAVPLWRGLLARTPESAEYGWGLASCLRAAGDLPGALDALVEFVRRNPTVAEIPAPRLAAWFRGFETTDEFLRLVKDRTGKADADFATHAVLGITAGAAGERDLAQRLFDAALAQQPDSALVHLAWGRLALVAYDWETALKHGAAALEAAPDLAAAQLLMGDAHAGLDQHNDAEAAYKAAVALRPEDAGCAYALGKYSRATGNLLAAQRYLQDAWSADRTQGDALEDLVDAYLEGGKLDIARQCLVEAEAADVGRDVLRRVRTVLRFVEDPLGPAHLAELERQFAEHATDARTGLRLGAGLYMADEPQRALEIVQKVQGIEPDSEQALYLLARVQLRRLAAPAAIDVLTRLVERYPRRVSTLRLLAEAQLTDFQLAAARATLERILTLDLDPDELTQHRLQLLTSYTEFREYDAALKRLDEWEAASSAVDVWPQARLRVLLMARQAAAAVELVDQRLQPAEERFQELMKEAETLVPQAAQAASDPALQARLEAFERDVNAAGEELFRKRSAFIQVCLEAEDWETAVARARAWVDEQPEHPQLRTWLIESLLAGEQSEEALAVIAKYVPRSEADLVSIATWRARAAAAAGNASEAVEQLRRLLTEPYVVNNPSRATQARQDIVEMLIEARDEGRAVDLCERWLAEAPADDDGFFRYSVLVLKRLALQRAEREDELIEVSQELLTIEPDDAGLNNDLGYTWIDRGENMDRAREMIERAVADDPLNPAYLDSLGWACYKAGDFDGARRWLSRATQLRIGQDAVVYDHLGDAEFRLGDRAAAERSWRRSVEIIEETAADQRRGADLALLARLRRKLEVLETSAQPALAPTAAEQQENTP